MSQLYYITSVCCSQINYVKCVSLIYEDSHFTICNDVELLLPLLRGQFFTGEHLFTIRDEPSKKDDIDPMTKHRNFCCSFFSIIGLTLLSQFLFLWVSKISFFEELISKSYSLLHHKSSEGKSLTSPFLCVFITWLVLIISADSVTKRTSKHNLVQDINYKQTEFGLKEWDK